MILAYTVYSILPLYVAGFGQDLDKLDICYSGSGAIAHNPHKDTCDGTEGRPSCVRLNSTVKGGGWGEMCEFG